MTAERKVLVTLAQIAAALDMSPRSVRLWKSDKIPVEDRLPTFTQGTADGKGMRVCAYRDEVMRWQGRRRRPFCQKCGSPDQPLIRFVKQDDVRVPLPNGDEEALQMQCSCGYEWFVRCYDKRQDERRTAAGSTRPE